MEPPTRIEQFNQVVRSLVTVGLLGGFLWGFTVSKEIGGDIFTTVFASVIGYWFASRDQKTRVIDDMRAQVAALPTTTTKTSDAVTVTTPTLVATPPRPKEGDD
jgi:hypothetical protein